jgi:hypothetical protein
VCSGFPPALACVPAPGAPVSLLLLAGLPALVGQVEGLGNRQSCSLRLTKKNNPVMIEASKWYRNIVMLI